MKATLGLELLGENVNQQLKLYKDIVDEALGDGVGEFVFGKWPPPCWVAKITGFDDKYKYKRQFQRYKKDYRYSNKAGSRGLYAWYILAPGYYEVKKRLSWSRNERYFCKVENGEIVRVDESEVRQWLKNHLE